MERRRRPSRRRVSLAKGGRSLGLRRRPRCALELCCPRWCLERLITKKLHFPFSSLAQIDLRPWSCWGPLKRLWAQFWLFKGVMNEQLLGVRLTSIKHSAFICKTAALCSLKDLHFNGSHFSYGWTMVNEYSRRLTHERMNGWKKQVKWGSGAHFHSPIISLSRSTFPPQWIYCKKREVSPPEWQLTIPGH